MSLKALELQIAIPKTFDAGKIADQQNQQAVSQQLHAQEATKREFERSRTVVQKSDNLDGIRDDEERQNGEYDSNQQRNKKNKDSNHQGTTQHPFKGNLFDFSG